MNESRKDIHSLPPEIIYEVFAHGLANSTVWQNVKYRVAISSVSKHWRALAFEEPRLWSNISIRLQWPLKWANGTIEQQVDDGQDAMRSHDIAELQRASVWIHRSKNAPLDIYLMLQNVPKAVQKQVKQLLSPHLHRCKSLRLRLHQYTNDVELKGMWFPLPDSLISLQDLDIHLVMKDDRDSGTLDLGPPLTLRQLRLRAPWTRTLRDQIFTSKFKVLGELTLNDLDSASTVNILKHCRDVKRVELWGERPNLMFHMNPSLRPHSVFRPWSFPAIHKLSVESIHQSHLEAAPNLKHLRFRETLPHIKWSPESIGVLSGLEVLEAGTLFQVVDVGNGCLLSSENLEAIGVSPRDIYLENDFEVLTSHAIAKILPLSWLIEQDLQKIPPNQRFPKLRLLVIDTSRIRRLLIDDIFELVKRIVRTRPDLILVFHCKLGFFRGTLQKIAQLIPGRVILSDEPVVMEELVKRHVRWDDLGTFPAAVHESVRQRIPFLPDVKYLHGDPQN